MPSLGVCLNLIKYEQANDPMSQIQKSISLNEQIWQKIDRIRQDLPRSRFVAKIIAKELDPNN